MLLQLPAEVARAVAALLVTDEIRQLKGVCRTMRLTYDVGATETLLLPPTDEAHVRRVVAGLHDRDPTKLARFEWIQVARPWHMDVLLDCGTAAAVRSVRVRTEIDHSPEAVDEICTKLVHLPNLKKLDVSDTALRDIRNVATMTQLRSLNLSRTDQIVDAAPLAALVHLEELVLRNTRVTDLSCIEGMVELRRLEATRGWGEEIYFPSLRALTKLHTLHVGMISVPSAVDFVNSLAHLKHLTVNAVYARSLDGAPIESHREAYVPVNSMVHGLPQLETIDDRNDAASSQALANIPNLRIIGHRIHSNPEALTVLLRLEELSLKVPATASDAGRTDYSFLSRLPRLQKITLDQSRVYRDDRIAAAEINTLLNVLSSMPQLKSLHREDYVDSDTTDAMSCLRQLTHLSVCVHSDVEDVEWIASFRSLRSLSIQFDSSDTDVSAIGVLPQLETLKVVDRSSRPHAFVFLQTLHNLTKLSFEGNIPDLIVLDGLTRLQDLTIAVKSVKPMKNYEVLGRLPRLRTLDISRTLIRDLSVLMQLKHLRSAVVSPSADCRVLANGRHPSLLRVLHPIRNCMWSCSYGTIKENEEIA